MWSSLSKMSHWRMFFIAMFVLVSGITVGLLNDPDGLRKYRALGEDAARLDAESAVMRIEIDALHKRLDALRNDPNALERPARELGFVRDDELLFELR